MSEQTKIFARNLQLYMRQRRKHQSDLSRDLDINKGSISAWYNGTRYPRPETMAKLAAYLGVTVSDLTAETVKEAESKAVRAIRIPVLGRVRAGYPAFADEDIIDEEEITEAFSRTGEYFALRIQGDSMEPRIRNGDTVIVRRQDTAEDGEIVIALVNGDDGVCKRLKHFKEGVMLISLNAAYEPMTFSHAEIDETPIRIVGVVKEVRSRL